VVTSIVQRLNLAVVEVSDDSSVPKAASVYGLSIVGHHMAGLIKQSTKPGVLTVELKSSDTVLLDTATHVIDSLYE
jgi:hypothetical protein